MNTKKETQINVKLSHFEKKAISLVARDFGLTLSEYIRESALNREDLKEYAGTCSDETFENDMIWIKDMLSSIQVKISDDYKAMDLMSRINIQTAIQEVYSIIKLYQYK